MKIIDYKNLTKDFFSKIEFETLESVDKIITAVKKDGDIAVKKYSEQFGDGKLENFEVTQSEIQNALNSVDENILEAIKYAVSTVKKFSEEQLACLKNLDTEINGVSLGHKVIPIETAGCYIPGGNYPLPSSAIMNIVPAKVAGVKKVIAVSPKMQPATIAAAYLAGADKIYKIGGVQAVAALAYGTESVEKVDIITGPGNKFVTAAKKAVYGECGIDFLAGPSEVLIVADDSANPDFVAADMLAQCEHDKDARAYLVTFSKDFAEEVNESALKFLSTLQTKEIAKTAFEKSFGVIVDNEMQAIELANKKAPEHLEICLEDLSNLDEFTNYGSLFVGNYSAEVFGDYVSGTNHVLPTNQVAKYSGGLSVFNFVKIQTYQNMDSKTASDAAKYASNIAEAEGLYAHKLASDLRK